LRNKLLNIHYCGGNGGEFLASYLQRHDNFNQEKNNSVDKNLEKYTFERDKYDLLSQSYISLNGNFEKRDPRLFTYSPKKFFEKYWTTSPDKWTLRVDHGYGYNVQTEEWQKGLYTDWNVSKTIILQPTTNEGAKYCRDLADIKVRGRGKGENKHKLDGISIRKRFHGYDIWNRPFEFNLALTQEYKDLIPEGYDYLEVDPMKVLHTDSEEEREEQLIRIFDYLDFDYSILDLGIILCENYRKNNLELHKSVFSNN